MLIKKYWIWVVWWVQLLWIKVNEVENEIPDHIRCIVTQEVSSKRLTAINFAGRLRQANLVRKTAFDNKPITFNRKITIDK